MIQFGGLAIRKLSRHRTLLKKCFISTSFAGQQQFKPQQKSKDDEINEEPMDYLGSKAASWSARKTRSGGADEVLWYQPYVVTGSVAIFLLYFCFLREENDIDKKLERNLYDHISGLEETQLAMAYKHNRDNGKDNRDIIKRLLELGIDPTKI